MMAADTSTWIAFFAGDGGADVEELDGALARGQVVLPPVVLSELFSDPKLPTQVAELLRSLHVLEVFDGYWERAGKIRATLLKRRQRARLADALIATSCIDHEVPLLSRDKDFRGFERFAGLALIC